ncbi:MAG: AEC family transporter [Caldimonas sp.]
MADPTLLLPDFLLILVGWVICRKTALGRPVWEAAERLVYYLLFPVLLFNSIVKSPLQPGQALNLAIAGLGTGVVGIVLATLVGLVPGVDRRLHASGAQTAFRFNSFICLALAQRLFGAEGLAWMALLIALSVPMVNVAAVWPLARHGGHSYFRELARNPLIISTVAGLVGNAVGLTLPAPVDTTLQRIGVAALPIGLMAVGAGLTFGALKDSPVLAAALLGIRHAVLPVVAIGFTFALALSPKEQGTVVLFAAVPTASSAYVLAARMGGAASFVAGLVMVSTLLGMVSIPLWLAVLQALH